jgi:hypothetical protein
MTPELQLQRLLDLEEIRQLVAKYNFAFDGRDEAAYVACWTQDGFVERRNSKPSCRGHAQLAALARDFPVNGRHITTDLVIDLQGDNAEMKNYMLYLDMGPPCEVSMFGVYFDKLVRTNEGWKFSERIFEPHTIRESETSAAFMSVVEDAARA